MLKFTICLLISSSVWCQSYTETKPVVLQDSNSVSHSVKLLGYQFYKGGFMSQPISNNLKIDYGLLHTDLDNLKIIEVPIFIKHRFGNKFHAFFGSKFDVILNNGSSFISYPNNASYPFGASLEFGLQYDVNESFMLEMRYSLPLNESSVYPAAIFNNNSGLFRLGTGLKF